MTQLPLLEIKHSAQMLRQIIPFEFTPEKLMRAEEISFPAIRKAKSYEVATLYIGKKNAEWWKWEESCKEELYCIVG